MSLVWLDRVHQISTTAGTGNLTLSPSIPVNKQAWSGIGIGNFSYGFAVSQTTAGMWEVNTFTLNSDGTLTRGGTPLASSNAGALVNFDGSNLDVILDVPASLISGLAAGGVVTFNTRSGGVTLTGADIYAPSAGGVYSVTNPTTSSDPNQGYLESTTVTVDNSLTNPNFSNISFGIRTLNATHGQNDYATGQGGQAKKTYFIDSYTINSWGCGQRATHNLTGNFYGCGDGFGSFEHYNFGGGSTDTGGEGLGIRDITCSELTTRQTATISSIVTPATINTTINQTVTKNKAAQEVAVVDSTGVSVGQWVTINAGNVSAANTMEVVQVTAVNATLGNSISGIFIRGHLTGETVLPTTVLALSNTTAWGEQRMLVNLNPALAYTTGTAAGIAGGSGAITGVGTSWSNTMVGGDASGINIGALSFAADNITATPFSVGSPLQTWFPIASVSSGLGLGIWRHSTAGQLGYPSLGLGTSQGSYTIAPAAPILAFDPITSTHAGSGVKVVLPYNTFVWTVGDTVVCAHSPDMDFSGDLIRAAFYTPGGPYRRMMLLWNTGIQPIAVGLELSGSGSNSGAAFTTGISLPRVGTGLNLSQTDTCGILMSNSLGAPNICWGGATGSGIYFDTSGHRVGVWGGGGTGTPGNFSSPGTGPLVFNTTYFSGGTFPSLYYGGNLIVSNGGSGNSASVNIMGGSSGTGWRARVDNSARSINFEYSGDGAGAVWTDLVSVDNSGQLAILAAGKGLSIKTGANCKMGTGTLSGGAATITTSAVTSSSFIFLTATSTSVNSGVLSVGTITNGTRFTVASSNGSDANTFNWHIIEPS